jgi:hypothetical protein
MLLRRCWELTSNDDLRSELIAYNIDDCRAAAVVAEALIYICGNNEPREEAGDSKRRDFGGQLSTDLR